MEGLARAATAVAATTTGSNAERSWDKSLSLASPPTALPSSSPPKESNENFPCLRWNRNPNPPRNWEVEQAKLDAAPPPPIEPLCWTLQKDALRERAWDWNKGEAWSLGCVEHATGIEAIKKGGGVSAAMTVKALPVRLGREEWERVVRREDEVMERVWHIIWSEGMRKWKLERDSDGCVWLCRIKYLLFEWYTAVNEWLSWLGLGLGDYTYRYIARPR